MVYKASADWQVYSCRFNASLWFTLARWSQLIFFFKCLCMSDIQTISDNFQGWEYFHLILWHITITFNFIFMVTFIGLCHHALKPMVGVGQGMLPVKILL